MVLTKAGLSRLLAEVLPHEGDVEAFAVASFGNAARRVARATDRAAKIALVVELAEPKTLLDKLSAAHPAAVARSEHLLAEDKRVAGAPLPDPGPSLGRDGELGKIGEAIHRDGPAALLVGPAGIGKTTLALAALHAQASTQRFGGRRYLARLDTSRKLSSAIIEIARAMGLVPEAPLRPRIVEALKRAPALLVLDDLDVVWGADPSNTADLLTELAAIDGVAILATAREELGRSVKLRTITVGPLADAAARDAFCAIAGASRRNDASLGFLLAELSGVPLAISLLAHATGDGPLDGAVRNWNKKQNELLMRPDGPERPSAVEIAVEVIQTNPTLTEESKSLLSLLAFLPNGLLAEDLATILPGTGAAASTTLKTLGLVLEAGTRLRLRRAVRESISTQAPHGELLRAEQFFSSLALSHGPKIGWPDSEASSERLAEDSDNIETMILRGFDGPNRIASVDAAVALATFLGTSGHATPRVIERARDIARETGDKLGEADCTQALGDIALARGETDEARARYLDALPLFHQARAALSEANCLMRLGDIASDRAELDEARHRYADAVPLFRQVGDKLGEATSLRYLGDIAVTGEEHDDARARYREAIPLFDEIGDKGAAALCQKGLGDIAFNMSEYDEARAVYEEIGPILQELGDNLGVAQCVQNLGDIAFARSEHGVAERHYQKALPLLREFGERHAEASCLQSLGDVALACAEPEDAQAYYLAALPLLREVGEKMGEANCIQSLGDIALTHFEHDQARSHYEEALGLFTALKDDYSIGWTHYRLAQVAADPEIFRNHIFASRDAWTNIGRQDLINDIANEFPGIF
jgi:tetratricopeptide (TPR) repeat protein